MEQVRKTLDELMDVVIEVIEHVDKNYDLTLMEYTTVLWLLQDADHHCNEAIHIRSVITKGTNND